MKDEINKIIQSISDFYKLDNALKYYLDRHKAQTLLDYITNLQEEMQKKEAMYDSLAVDYRLSQEENERLNNIINGMEKFFQYAYDNEVRPLNDRKVSVWIICLDKLQELKGSE